MCNIDGKMNKIIDITKPLILREAVADDCMQYWQWANEPSVREMAFDQNHIPWEQHQKWYHHKLTSPDTHLFILKDQHKLSLGQIRFEQAERGVFEIDISIAPNCQSMGLGRLLVEEGEALLREKTELLRLRSLIKSENHASIALFKSTGFVQTEACDQSPNSNALIFEKECL